MREKAKVDLEFQRRLLEFIGQVASETLPPSPSVSIQEEFKKGSRVFQPLLNPDHPYFDDQIKVDVYDIVTLSPHETCTTGNTLLHASSVAESDVEPGF